MARQKKPALILAFDKTFDAMAVENYCLEHGLPGRLIPVPREINSDCGFSWRADPKDEEFLLSELKNAGLKWSAVYKFDL